MSNELRVMRFKKSSPMAENPSKANDGDAGFDLTAIECNETDKYVEYNTGICVEIPDGYMGMLACRSSVSKKDLLLCNGVGIIDSGYRGELKFRFKKTKGSESDIYTIGERVGQLVIFPIPFIVPIESQTLDDSERGEGGFGSSGV
jgi:dUTP pyrophosphatase